MMRVSAFVVCLLLLSAGVRSAAGQADSVRITSARANVRAAPEATAAVLTQVVAGAVLVVTGTDGDWYRIRLPPDERFGGARVEGWISRTVAAPIASTPGEAAAPRTDVLGITVALLQGAGATRLSPQTATVRVIDAAADSLRGLLSVFPAGETPLVAQGSAPATFVWTLPGRSAELVIDERRPALLVTYADVEGALAAELAPTLVRLAPTLSGVRLVASVRALADQAAETTATWNLTRDLRQDPVRSAVDAVGPGVTRLQPSSNLDAGEYAVVIRLRRPVSGAVALSPDGDGRILAAIWSFSIR